MTPHTMGAPFPEGALEEAGQRVADALPDDPLMAVTLLAGLLALATRVLAHELGDATTTRARRAAIEVFETVLEQAPDVDDDPDDEEAAR